MMRTNKRRTGTPRLFAAGLITLLCAVIMSHAGTFAEPSTIFYGKVVGTGSEQPFLITEGELTWTILRSDGTTLELSEELYTLDDDFSYQLQVPHEALSFGLSASGGSVPLAASETTQTHLLITVNGEPAMIVGPSGDSFDVDQARRASTYRLDLALDVVATDSDGDGIPDWWEDLFGLDKQDPDDAALDTDGDGLANLQEYLGGFDPNRDSRTPELKTASLRAYAEGITGIRLIVGDSDSEAADLRYTLTMPPESGVLKLRNAAGGGDLELAGDDTFTQEDVLQGRLVYVHASPDDGVDTVTFQVSLADEDPAHPVARQNVALNLYRPAGDDAESTFGSAVASCGSGMPCASGVDSGEDQAVFNYLLSRDLGYVIWDAMQDENQVAVAAPSAGLSATAYQQDYMPLYGPDLSQVLCGGMGADTLIGGMENDILVGGPDADILAGSGGADLFVLKSAADGPDLIQDFSVADGDAVDVSRLFDDTSANLRDYLAVSRADGDSRLDLNSEGKVDSGTNLTVTFTGSELADADLYDLVDDGNLLVGDKVLPPRIEIVAVDDTASENGPEAGLFELRRRGDLAVPLTVDITISGSAANGSDYEYLQSSVVFTAGQATAVLEVMPYVDSANESPEVAQILLNAGTGYELATADTASITIEDLVPVIAVEAIEPTATQDPLQAGLFILRRSGDMDGSVVVLLRAEGTASAGTDYATALPSYVVMDSHQETAVLEVMPEASADLSGGGKSVDLMIRADSSYVLGSPSAAQVMVVEAQRTFEEWKSEHFPDVTESAENFAVGDYGNRGIPNVLRYAFGLDPVDPQPADGAPVYDIQQGRLAVTFRKAASAEGIEYIVEVSEDLTSWLDGAAYVEQVTPADIYADDAEMATYRSKLSPADGGSPKQYIRVLISYQP
jgi:Ca2+-binding RTX toxin-like protein